MLGCALARQLQRTTVAFRLVNKAALSSSPVLRLAGGEPWIPEYEFVANESAAQRRRRLLYQSRKRGMLENGLLLGSFADKYLNGFTEEQLVLYDRLINLPSNDWDIFKWATGAKETPKEYDNEIMDLLKNHTRNEDRESRVTMPDLKPVSE